MNQKITSEKFPKKIEFFKEKARPIFEEVHKTHLSFFAFKQKLAKGRKLENSAKSGGDLNGIIVKLAVCGNG